MEGEGEREWEREGEEKREGRARLGDDEPALFRVAFVASAVMAGSGRVQTISICRGGAASPGALRSGLVLFQYTPAPATHTPATPTTAPPPAHTVDSRPRGLFTKHSRQRRRINFCDVIG